MDIKSLKNTLQKKQLEELSHMCKEQSNAFTCFLLNQADASYDDIHSYQYKDILKILNSNPAEFKQW